MKAFKQTAGWIVRILVPLIGSISPCWSDILGDRPLLVILVEVPNANFSQEQTLGYFRSKIFGPDEPNVTAYFDGTSHGRFRYVPATDGDSYGAVDGVVRVTMEESLANREFRTRVLELADTFFDYGQYDNNGDGEISDQELTVLAIQSYQGGVRTGRKGFRSCS